MSLIVLLPHVGNKENEMIDNIYKPLRVAFYS